MIRFRVANLGATAALAVLALAGCNRGSTDNPEAAASDSAAVALPSLPATLPMVDAPAPQQVAAPAAAALPKARPIHTVRLRDAGGGAEYAWADAAYRFSDALGEAPPDYGFDYGGVRPWARQGYDNSVAFAEPVTGGYRTYYYRPGEEQPYFVRDPDYGYGYDQGRLAVVYAGDGAVVPWADYGRQVLYAANYLARGRDLWRASQSNRAPISVQSWTTYNNTYFIEQNHWSETRARQPGWVSFAQQDADAQRHWQAEQARRAEDARRFADWQAQGFRDAPPPRAIPPEWRQASWARDPHRFAPAAAAVAGGAALGAGALLARDHARALAVQRLQPGEQAQVQAAQVAQVHAGQVQAAQAQARAMIARDQMRQRQAVASEMRLRQQGQTQAQAQVRAQALAQSQAQARARSRAQAQTAVEQARLQEGQRQQAALRLERDRQARAAQRRESQWGAQMKAREQARLHQRQQAMLQIQQRRHDQSAAQQRALEQRAQMRVSAGHAEHQQPALRAEQLRRQANAQQARTQRASMQRAQVARVEQQQQARAAIVAQRRDQTVQRAAVRATPVAHHGEPRPAPKPEAHGPHPGRQER